MVRIRPEILVTASREVTYDAAVLSVQSGNGGSGIVEEVDIIDGDGDVGGGVVECVLEDDLPRGASWGLPERAGGSVGAVGG